MQLPATVMNRVGSHCLPAAQSRERAMEREGRRYICLKVPFEICAGLVVVQTVALAYHTLPVNTRTWRDRYP